MNALPPDAFTHIESPLDRKIKVTRFPSRGAYSKTELTLSLRELETMIRRQVASDKEGLPWFKFATFGDSRTDKNCLRHDRNVLLISGVEGDYDKGEITPLEAKSRLEAAGIVGLIYTTPSHLQPGKGNRWRVKCPLSSSCEPSTRELFMRRLNGLFGGHLDPASFNLSQSYFAGNVTGRPEMETYLVDGRCIDTAADLDGGALGKAASGTAGGLSGNSEALMAHAKHCILMDRSFEEYRHAISGNPAALAHVDKERVQSHAHAERAILNAWKRSNAHGEVRSATIHKFPLLDPSKPTFDADVEDFIGNGPTDWGRSLDDLDGSPSREYLVKGILSRGDVGCIFGAPGAGKSLIAPRLAFAVAAGEPIFGRRTRPGKVFYVAAEDEHGMGQRLKALRQLLGEGATGNLRLAGCPEGLNKDSEDLKRLIRAVDAERPALIVIDTLAMAFPGLDENDARSMGNVVHVAKQLAERGAAVLLIHHDTKEGGSTPRGHSVLNGALDMAVHVKPKDEAGVIRGRMTKNRNGSCDQDLAFTIGVESFGLDEDGDPIEAPFARLLDPSTASKPADRVHLPPAAKAALQVLVEMVGGETSGASEVDEACWRKRCRESGIVSADDDSKIRQQAVRRAVEALIRAGRVSLGGGKATLILAHGVLGQGNPAPDDDDDPVGDGRH